MTQTRTRAKFYARLLVSMLRETGVRGGEMAKVQRGARHVSIPIRLKHPADLSKATSISKELATGTGTRHVMVARRLQWIIYQFELPEGQWEKYTRRDLQDDKGKPVIGIGLGEARRQVDLDFGRAPHLLIAGSSQVSGKSTCLHSLLAGLMTTHAPGELEVLLIDPAADCETLHASQYLKLPAARTPEQAAQVLDKVMEIKKQREQQNARTGSGLPTVVLAIDEAQDIVPLAGRQAELAVLGQQAGKWDMHLLIATQKPLEENLPGLLFNLSHRLIGLVPTVRDSTLLSGHAGLHCEQLTGAGDFVYVQGGNTDEVRLQVAMATDEDVAVIPRGRIENDWPGLSVNQPQCEPAPINKGGRPNVQVVPRVVARYMWAMWKRNLITEKQARAAFGVARTGHVQHREFAQTCVQELERLACVRK